MIELIYDIFASYQLINILMVEVDHSAAESDYRIDSIEPVGELEIHLPDLVQLVEEVSLRACVSDSL